MDEEEHEEGPPALIMPFIVCQSEGGPYDDASFVAGYWFGKIATVLATGGNWLSYVPTGLVPQLDLLAMQHHRKMLVADVEDDATWALVRIE